MDLPTDISQLVGYYVVETLFDLQLLVRSGFLLSHRNALRYTHLQFRDMNDAGVINPQVFAGIRSLKFTQSYHDCTALAMLAPDLEELDLGQCGYLDSTHSIGLFSKLHTLNMNSCHKFSGFDGHELRILNLVDCGPIFGEFTTLEHLSLKFCFIGKITKFSPKLRSLKMHSNSLDIDFTKCYDRTVQEFEENWYFDLGELTCLTDLIITVDVYFRNAHAHKIKHLKNLKRLELRDCPLVTDFSFLQSLPALRELSVDGTFDWNMLAYMSLESFSSTSVPVEKIHTLANQTELTALHLEQIVDILSDPTPALCVLLPRLTKLHTLKLKFWHLFTVCFIAADDFGIHVQNVSVDRHRKLKVLDHERIGKWIFIQRHFFQRQTAADVNHRLRDRTQTHAGVPVKRE